MKKTLKLVCSYWKVFILILTPLVLLPLPLRIGTRPANCAYVIFITATYWMTEVLPIGVTSLLPVLLFPMLGVNPIETVSEKYLRQVNMLFIGSLIVAVAVEDSNLHKRIALKVLMIVGTQLKWLMFGCMGITAFLSMWITNTSTTAMMLPIMQAILTELEDVGALDENVDSALQMKDIPGSIHVSADKTKSDQDYKFQKSGNDQVAAAQADVTPYRSQSLDRTRKGFILCIAYAANIGGTGSLTGTGPNLELAGQLDTFYGHGVHGVNFASWFFFCFPNAVLTLIISWMYINIFYLGFRQFLCCARKTAHEKELDKQKKTRIQQVVKNLYDDLGQMSFNEYVVLSLFITLALLWITRNPQFIPGAKGWGAIFLKGYVTDATAALLICICFFIFPKYMPEFGSTKETPKILNWKTVHHKLSWEVVLLMGAGFAIAFNVQDSGLSAYIGDQLLFLADIPVAWIIFSLCVIVALITELASNTAIATIVIPILVELSKNLQVHPLYLMLPSVISTSFAFMLPVATPPNALVFASGHLKISDMVKCGVFMNIICILVLQFSVNTYGIRLFNLDVFPDWAAPATAPSAVNITINATTPTH